jgi:Lrp/AsnC family transcriptional regulator for asnA, asnC and gidA
MIDEFDCRLIKELQKDGRQTYIELGKKLGVVEGTIRKRIKVLRDKGVIRIIAVPNLSNMGYNFTCTMCLQVRLSDLRNVANTLAQNPNVSHLAFITGRYDLIARIILRSPEELSKFIEEEISAIPSVLRTETFVDLDKIKEDWSGIDSVQFSLAEARRPVKSKGFNRGSIHISAISTKTKNL